MGMQQRRISFAGVFEIFNVNTGKNIKPEGFSEKEFVFLC